MAVAMFNSDGEFLQWIDNRKAVMLLFLEEANPVGETGLVWRSPSVSIGIPRGLILKNRATRFMKHELAFSRDRMLKRDNYTCQYCGAKGPGVELTKDHVIPKAQGGEDSWENCVTACFPCNNKKGNRRPEQAKMKLLKDPRRPKVMDSSEVWNLIFDPEAKLPEPQQEAAS